MNRRDLAKKRRREQYQMPAPCRSSTREEIETRRLIARECGIGVVVISVPTMLTPQAAKRLSDDGLAYRLESEPTVADYVMPHPLRHDKPVRFEDAVKAYDRAHGTLP